MSHLLIFGPGYTAKRIADAIAGRGWTIETVGRDQIQDRKTVAAMIGRASHILSSVPPEGDQDPVLLYHADALAVAPARWIGYISSTGVYGDCAGGWVDETAPVSGRRGARNAADQGWQTLHRQVRIFRLPGIYGTGRSAIDRVRAGTAVRVDVPDQVFSRIHVDDIVSGVIASIEQGPAGIYNLADDAPCAQNDVLAYAARLLGTALPPLLSLDDPRLSPQARAFYAENRRVANGKAKRLLGWKPRYADFRQGLAVLL